MQFYVVIPSLQQLLLPRFVMHRTCFFLPKGDRTCLRRVDATTWKKKQKNVAMSQKPCLFKIGGSASHFCPNCSKTRRRSMFSPHMQKLIHDEKQFFCQNCFGQGVKKCKKDVGLKINKTLNGVLPSLKRNYLVRVYGAKDVVEWGFYFATKLMLPKIYLYPLGFPMYYCWILEFQKSTNAKHHFCSKYCSE